MSTEDKRVYYGGQYKVLDEGEIKEIHESTMEVLEETGFQLKYPPLLDLMEENGAKVDINRFFPAFCYSSRPVMGGVYSLEGLR